MNRYQAYTVSEFDTDQRGVLEAIEKAFAKINGREMNEDELNSVLYFVSSGSDEGRASDAFVLAMKSAYDRGYIARMDEEEARMKALIAERQAEAAAE